MIVKGIQFLRDHFKTFKIVLIVYLVAIIVFDMTIHRDPKHSYFWFDSFLDYWTLFSVVGCFLLIKVGKGIAHAFLSKNEDFYG